MIEKNAIPVTAYLVLALLAENRAHGYELEQLVWNRGFRFWTDIRRSSIYNALKLLENKGWIKAKTEEGGGPNRRVYQITQTGRKLVEREGIARLSAPAHPHSEIDLGIYILPFLSTAAALKAVKSCRNHLKSREEFLKERLKRCRKNSLELPALAFERPLLSLQAELKWLNRVEKKIKDRTTLKDGWARYEYKEPPGATTP